MSSDEYRKTAWETTHLAEKSLQGDLEALGVLVTRFSGHLLALAEYWISDAMRSKVSPEDLVQDAWMQAIPQLATLETRGASHALAVRRYLCTVLRNRYLSLLRKRGEQELTSEVRRAGEFRVGVAAEDAIRNVIRNEEQQSIREAIERLEDPIDRELVYVHGLEQASLKETAAILGMSVTAITTRYSRALKKLQRLLPREELFRELSHVPDSREGV